MCTCETGKADYRLIFKSVMTFMAADILVEFLIFHFVKFTAVKNVIQCFSVSRWISNHDYLYLYKAQDALFIPYQLLNKTFFLLSIELIFF